MHARALERGQATGGQQLCLVTLPKGSIYVVKTDFNRNAQSPDVIVLFADDNLHIHPGDIWSDISTTGIAKEGGVPFQNGKKPLSLVQRIIGGCRKDDAVVLDFFAGSGTTLEAVSQINDSRGVRWQTILVTNNSAAVGKTFNPDGGNEGICQKVTIPRIKNVLETGPTPRLQRCHVFKLDYLHGHALADSDRNAVRAASSALWVASGLTGKVPVKLDPTAPYVHPDCSFAVLPPDVPAQDLIELLGSEQPPFVWVLGDETGSATRHLVASGVPPETIRQQFRSYKQSIERSARESES